jgi:4-amino-4-deoxy-L-arabinose transferase-like glycosyltransferase
MESAEDAQGPDNTDKLDASAAQAATPDGPSPAPAANSASAAAPAAASGTPGLLQTALGSGQSLYLSGLFLVMSAACAVFFSGLGQYPLFNPDEALYAEPAREMLVTGEYITTLLNYVVRYTKPPLVIWAMAASYKVFGVNEFAARFFGVACGAILVALTYLLIARYVSVRAAIIGGLSLVVAPLFVLTAREAITDMPLALFMAGSQMALFHAFKTKRFGFALSAYVLLGLAVMTKGPVGIVLPLAIIFAYHFLRGEIKQALRFYQPYKAALVIGAISVPWFVLEIWITKGAYFQEFIVRENFQRFTAVVDSHKQPFWYHAAAMFGGYLPFSLYLPQIFAVRLRNFFPGLFQKRRPKETLSYLRLVLLKFLQSLRGKDVVLSRFAELRNFLKAQTEADDLYFYCFLWAISVLVFFSMSVSKLLPYTLPAFPAMAILVGGELESAFVNASFARVCFPMLAALLAYAGAGIIAPNLMLKSKHLPADLPALVKSFAAVQAAIAFIAIVLGRLRRYPAAVTTFAIASCATFGAYLKTGVPIISAKLEGQLPDFCHYVGQSDLPIIVFDMRKPGVPFYAHRRVENINGGEELKARLSQIPSAYILTTVNKIDFLQTIKNAKVISHGDDYALVHFAGPETAE